MLVSPTSRPDAKLDFMREEHYFFECPDDNAKIWRYLSLSKFLAMLTTNTVYFRRADRLEDPFEGAAPEAARAAVEKMFDGEFENAPEMAEQYMSLIETMRRFTFLNCWHVNDTESDAMWKLYSLTNEGVAIQSTVGHLKRWLDGRSEKFFVGLARYANYDELPPEVFLNGVTPYVFKRKSFEHERELRALLWFQATADGEGNYPREAAESGRAVPVNLGELIEGVYVSPLAEQWFAELVTSLVGAYNLGCPVVQSRLYARPGTLEPDPTRVPDPTVHLTEAVVGHLHAQHLQYIDQKHRERERLARRQYAVIERWLRSIERDVDRITYRDLLGREHHAKQALLNFADDILPQPLNEVVSLTLFRLIFSLTGRFANAFNAFQNSVLPPDELLLLVKRFFTLYCETVYSTHVAMLSKREEPVAREDDATMVQSMANQGLAFIRLMKDLKI